LKIDEELGHKEGMAIDYRNIGLLYETKKDYKKAREYLEKSLALNKALGSPNAKKMQDWLDGLPR
jgi:tetratricopeptide (TPR) repeat protein